ncbi:MAG: alpha/beta hydrolase [Rhodospirillaceae bacterium]|nr:alpha/beta hydrolase [Rhodospirillaceae bacterium]
MKAQTLMDISITENVSIGAARGSARPLTADLYVPQSDSVRAAVVLVFGGGWSTGDKTQQKAYGIKLAKAGIVAMATDYRLSGEAHWPAQLDDVTTAIAWLQANAAEYRIDPKRIGISGNSSGGHLALMAALNGATIAAVCAFYPPTDLATLLKHGDQGSIAGLLGGDTAPEKLSAASPLTRVHKNCPPVMLLAGDADTRVPVAQTLSLYEALRGVGVPTELHVFPGLGHAFDFDRGMAVLASTLMAQFFTTQMK